MCESASYRGLCSTCRKARECTFPREAGVPVVRCEAFEAAAVPGDGGRPAAGQGGLGFGAASSPGDSCGLCSTCENREVCQLRRPAGPVWQCEEYR